MKTRYLTLLITIGFFVLIYLSKVHWVFELALNLLLIVTIIYGAFIFCWPLLLFVGAFFADDMFSPDPYDYEYERYERNNK